MSQQDPVDAPRRSWPGGKTFAFAIFDDTDNAIVENVGPVYEYLDSIGIRSTKSVWALAGGHETALSGATCDDPGYREWTLDIQSRGFEIASHLSSYVTSTREETVRGMDRFREIYGHDPVALANHSGCEESIYWGSDRVTGANRLIYNGLTGRRNSGTFRGGVEGDALFWGDVCKARVKYVRNFTFGSIDTLHSCPEMPYHDPKRPYVNQWFAASEGSDVATFNRCLSEDNQRRLEEAGSACIMYTHFAAGFYQDGRLDPVFRECMARLADRDGWFVPVSELLDYLAAERGPLEITDRQRRSLERRWLRSKLQVGPS